MDKSTVYLAVMQDHIPGDGFILGVYHTREEAQARIEQAKIGSRYMEFHVEETEVGRDRWPGV